jgi:hypothetical protein
VLSWLCALQSLAALFILAVPAALTWISADQALFVTLARGTSPAALLTLAVLLVPPAALTGSALPLLATCKGSRAFGLLYTSNTVGSVFGRPRQGLGIALGTGQTFGTVFKHGFLWFDCVEIDPEVISLSTRWFADYNGRLFERPGVHVHQGSRVALGSHAHDRTTPNGCPVNGARALARAGLPGDLVREREPKGEVECRGYSSPDHVDSEDGADLDTSRVEEPAQSATGNNAETCRIVGGRTRTVVIEVKAEFRVFQLEVADSHTTAISP